MSSNVKARWTIAAYVILMGGSVWVYHHFTYYRDALKFWIPQSFLMIMIAVTTLYVLYTADLVKETRQLQQRPMMRVRFFTTDKLPELKFDKTFSTGQNTSDEMKLKVLGGQELPPNYLVVEFRNIGHVKVRECVAQIKFTAANGLIVPDEKILSSEIDVESSMLIAVAPLVSPWVTVQLEGITYGDGLRMYNDFSGGRRFSTSQPISTGRV